MFTLDKEQEYVLRQAQALGLDLQLKYHLRATDTCAEKLELLQEQDPKEEWSIDRIIKTIYFTKGGHTVGVVIPEFGRDIPVVEVIGSALGLSIREASGYRKARREELPQGMEYGTCTPFPLESSLGYDIHELIVVEHAAIKDKLCDISVGGSGEEAHRVSMQLPYRGIRDILEREFSERVHSVTLLSQVRQESFL